MSAWAWVWIAVGGLAAAFVLVVVLSLRRSSAGIVTSRFGRTVRLASGDEIVADAAYVRESILTPAAKVVAGYQPVMPTFQGQVNEEQILALIAYIESLRVPTQASPPPVRAPARAPTSGASSR